VKRLAVVGLVLALTQAHAQAPADTYERTARVAHLAAALAALRDLGDAGRLALERELHDAVRLRCKTGARPACMIDVARELCSTRVAVAACTAATDVMLTNQHAEHDLLDAQTRARLVRTSTDYHAAVLAELTTIYRLLAGELVLAAHPDREVPAQIDRFCAARDEIARRCEPGATACVGSIAYQRCAAGLIWFISGAPR